MPKIVEMDVLSHKERAEISSLSSIERIMITIGDISYGNLGIAIVLLVLNFLYFRTFL